jgi:hypothetical protein
MGMTEQEQIKELTNQVTTLKVQVESQQRLIETMKSMPGIKEALSAKSKDGLHVRAQKKSRQAIVIRKSEGAADRDSGLFRGEPKDT